MALTQTERRSGTRPWLRLVRATSGALGPVSPELALVDAPLAEAACLTPEAVVVADAGAEHRVAAAPDETWERSWGSPTEPVLYDTRDLLLERHGLKLELTSEGAARAWRLTAARGEVVEAVAEGPGVPDRIESLLRNVVLGEELVHVPQRSADPEIRLLEDHLATQRRSLVKHDVGARIASDPESLHQLRVAARRTRASLGVARSLVDGVWAREIKDGMRDVGRASNEARDIDILLERLREQIRTLDLRDQAAGAALLRELEEDRRSLQQALLAVLNSGSHRRVLDRMALPAAPAAEPPTRKLDQLAGRELRRLVARVRKLGKRPGDEALHGLRINVKRVRYAAELAGAPTDKRTQRVIKAATRMQDVLGEHQDSVVGEERLRDLAYKLDESGIAFVAGRLAEQERVRRNDIHARLPSAWKELRKLARKSR